MAMSKLKVSECLDHFNFRYGSKHHAILKQSTELCYCCIEYNDDECALRQFDFQYKHFIRGVALPACAPFNIKIGNTTGQVCPRSYGTSKVNDFFYVSGQGILKRALLLTAAESSNLMKLYSNPLPLLSNLYQYGSADVRDTIMEEVNSTFHKEETARRMAGIYITLTEVQDAVMSGYYPLHWDSLTTDTPGTYHNYKVIQTYYPKPKAFPDLVGKTEEDLKEDLYKYMLKANIKGDLSSLMPVAGAYAINKMVVEEILKAGSKSSVIEVWTPMVLEKIMRYLEKLSVVATQFNNHRWYKCWLTKRTEDGPLYQLTVRATGRETGFQWPSNMRKQIQMSEWTILNFTPDPEDAKQEQ